MSASPHGQGFGNYFGSASRRPTDSSQNDMSEQHQPTPQTRQLVELLSFAGYTQVQIAAVVTPAGISVPTLKLHYGTELNVSKVTRLAGVAGMALQMAMGRPAKYDEKDRLIQAEIKPNPAMVMFLCKTQLGWKETNVIEHVDPSAGARDRLARAVDSVLASFKPAGGAAPGAAEPPDSERVH